MALGKTYGSLRNSSTGWWDSLLERSRTGMSVSRDSNQTILQTSFDKVRWSSCQEPCGVALHTSTAQRAGSISWKQSSLLLSHTVKPSMSSWSEGAASRRSGLQLALRPPDPALLPGTWCHAGYKTIYKQAPCLQALQATKQTQNVTMFLQPPKQLLYPSSVERSPWKSQA